MNEVQNIVPDSDDEQNLVEGKEAIEPLFRHPVEEPTAFDPAELVSSVRESEGMDERPVPDVCVLDFDGDLTDKLVRRGQADEYEHWPCFHTRMWLWPADDPLCGIVPRTIGGPYSVLVAEQMAVCGADVVVGLASAGRLNRDLPLPSVVVADKAIRDEGTSSHYLEPGRTVAGHPRVADALQDALPQVGLPVRRGLVWTTDAPYRETSSQISRHAADGALAVEMQAASLFAFGQHHGFPVGLVAHVTNAIDHDGKNFEKGPDDTDISILGAVCRGARKPDIPLEKGQKRE